MMRAISLAMLATGAASFRAPMKMDAGMMQATWQNCMERVGGTLGLERSDYTDQLGLANAEVGGARVESVWFKEASTKFLTGVAASKMEVNGQMRFQLDAWMGPSYEVPHMTLCLTSTPTGKCTITADYIARADLTNCMDFIREEYYGPAVQEWWAKGAAAGAPLSPPAAWQGRLISSPACLSVELDNAQTAAALAEEHVARWLSWLEGAQPIIARQRGAMNSRDDSIRRFVFATYATTMAGLVGDAAAGQKLAAAVSGPVSEAYVGGAS